jgi:hypothetical protein
MRLPRHEAHDASSLPGRPYRCRLHKRAEGLLPWCGSRKGQASRFWVRAGTILQKATTGEVNWGQVALSGALGGFGGASIAARAGFTGMKATLVAGARVCVY